MGSVALLDGGLVAITPQLISLLEVVDAQLESLFSQRTLRKEKEHLMARLSA